MADYKDIELSKLLLDSLNPRLDRDEKTQPATLAKIVRTQGAKLVELAEDIATFGLSPLDGFLVMSVPRTSGDYVVLEGNRRTTALKLLANPALGDDGLNKPQAAKLAVLAKQAGVTNAKMITCVVVKSRGEAEHWLQLRHGGEQDGVGLVKWGAKEKAREQELRTGKPDPYLALLSHLVTEGAISEDEASAVKYSNLERALDGHVRNKLGIHVDKSSGVVSSHFPKAETLKGLGAFAKKLSVSTVYAIDKAGDRKKFIAELASELPDPKKKLKAARPLDGNGSAGARGNAGAGSGGKKPRPVKEPTTVAPPSPPLIIKHKRINRIYGELRRLKTETNANSGAVMMRVFLELTVDDYINANSIPRSAMAQTAAPRSKCSNPRCPNYKVPKPPEPKLHNKLLAVADHLEKSGSMTKAQLKPIRTVGGGDKWLATSIDSLHAYVHNKDFHPSPGDVRAVWDTLEPLFVHIWK